MTTATPGFAQPIAPSKVHAKLAKGPGRIGMVAFAAFLTLGLVYAASQLVGDLSHVRTSSAFPFLFLGVALLIALGFEFVNGFHDTANAVATVIYTHTLDPHIAVVWSGVWNFIGVLVSTGGVAFGIISLLPVELILQVGGGAGFAMVFALLAAAILWNLGTWWLGLPSSSSHTLIGSIIGVGLANQMMHKASATSGVDWGQAGSVGKSLLISPIVGFVCAGLLLLVMKAIVPNKRLYEAPANDEPPPFWIRCLLVLTCTGVSFAHGSNDGQKGMGLIMLILIGIVPGAFALKMGTDSASIAALAAQAQKVTAAVEQSANGTTLSKEDADAELKGFLKGKNPKSDKTFAAISAETAAISAALDGKTSFNDLSVDDRRTVRGETYLAAETIGKLDKGKKLEDIPAKQDLTGFKKQSDKITKYIPDWVKIAVALALGFGTMIGWKRIVVTVGEKIGKEHLTYAQGASAEIVTWAAIQAADNFGLPVSTTHILSSGIAGTMAANGSGLQAQTLRNIVLAWVLTLPVCIFLGAVLFASGLFIVFNVFGLK